MAAAGPFFVANFAVANRAKKRTYLGVSVVIAANIRQAPFCVIDYLLGTVTALYFANKDACAGTFFTNMVATRSV